MSRIEVDESLLTLAHDLGDFGSTAELVVADGSRIDVVTLATSS